MLSGDLFNGPQHVRVHVAEGKVRKVELLPLKPGASAAKTVLPKASGPDAKVLAKALAEVRAYLAGKLKRFTVPFAQSGTEFQVAVWAALRSVPYGQAVTYGELATMAGKPQAARAVGSAMNRNQLPLIIPCHRVVASDGIGGFGCGLGWKKQLLAVEHVLI